MRLHHRQITSQFQGKRTIPFVATDQKITHERDITGTLRAKEAPKHIRESWVGTSWIAAMAQARWPQYGPAGDGDASARAQPFQKH